MWVAIHVHVGGDSWLTTLTSAAVPVDHWVARPPVRLEALRSARGGGEQ